MKTPEEFLPRHQCAKFMEDSAVIKTEPILLTKESFDFKVRINAFTEGPHLDTYGDNPGEPYNPHRQAFGILSRGIPIYCEIDAGQDKRVRDFKSLKCWQ